MCNAISSFRSICVIKVSQNLLGLVERLRSESGLVERLRSESGLVERLRSESGLVERLKSESGFVGDELVSDDSSTRGPRSAPGSA